MHRNACYGPLFGRVANVFAKYCLEKNTPLPAPHSERDKYRGDLQPPSPPSSGASERVARDFFPDRIPGTAGYFHSPALPTLRGDRTRYWHKTNCSPFALRPWHSLRPLQGGEFRRHTKAPSRSIAPKAEGITQTVQPWRRLSDTRRNRLRDLPCKEAALPPEQLPVTPVARGEGGEGPKPLPRPVV